MGCVTCDLTEGRGEVPGGVPVHVHFVVQPVTRVLMDEIGAHGPQLQVAMFASREEPPADEVERFADRARAAFAAAA